MLFLFVSVSFCVFLIITILKYLQVLWQQDWCDSYYVKLTSNFCSLLLFLLSFSSSFPYWPDYTNKFKHLLATPIFWTPSLDKGPPPKIKEGGPLGLISRINCVSSLRGRWEKNDPLNQSLQSRLSWLVVIHTLQIFLSSSRSGRNAFLLI